MKLEKQGKQGRQPNARLRQQRLLRGWSLQRVVEELCKLAAEEERLPGVNEAMVSNWENGRKKPSPFYQERLCKLYRMSAAQLGFMEPVVFPPIDQLEVDQPGFSVFQPSPNAQASQSASSDDLFSPYDRTWELSTFFQQSANGQRHVLALLSQAVKQGILEAVKEVEGQLKDGSLDGALSRRNTGRVAPHLSYRGSENEGDMIFDPLKRETILKLLGIAGTVATSPFSTELWEGLSQATVKPPAVHPIDLDLANNYVEALRILLTRGEAQYVMHASQDLYNKLIQDYPSSRDRRLAETQLQLGMLVGAAQEYALPWYQRDQAVMRTYNHIEDNIIGKFDGKHDFRHEYAQLLAKRGRQHRVLWQFEACKKACEDGISSLKEINDTSLYTHFLCERAHVEATRGDELLWMRNLEVARIGVLQIDLVDREKALNQVDYMQGEGYKRFAFHTQKDLSMPTRERYAKRAIDQFTQWRGATIELPGFESLVAQVSKAQCLILLDPDNAIHLAEQLRKLAEQRYPALLDKIHRVVFLAQQRLELSGNEFLQIFKEASNSAYHVGRNIL